ncbi:MAG: hypothetical protein WCW26_01525 [Candidatus Buchananbacteria bacterium]
MIKGFWQWLAGWLARKCCVCGSHSIWPSFLLYRNDMVSRYNPDGRAVWIHHGWCMGQHINSAERLVIQQGVCCVCDQSGLHLGEVHLPCKYNPDGEIKKVHRWCLGKYTAGYLRHLFAADRW